MKFENIIYPVLRLVFLTGILLPITKWLGWVGISWFAALIPILTWLVCFIVLVVALFASGKDLEYETGGGDDEPTLIWGHHTVKMAETPDVLSEIISGRAIREFKRGSGLLSEFSGTLHMKAEDHRRMVEQLSPLAYTIRLSTLMGSGALITPGQLLISYADAWRVVSTQSIFGVTPGMTRMNWYVALHKQYANSLHADTVKQATNRLTAKWGWVDRL